MNVGAIGEANRRRSKSDSDPVGATESNADEVSLVDDSEQVPSVDLGPSPSEAGVAANGGHDVAENHPQHTPQADPVTRDRPKADRVSAKPLPKAPKVASWMDKQAEVTALRQATSLLAKHSMNSEAFVAKAKPEDLTSLYEDSRAAWEFTGFVADHAAKAETARMSNTRCA